MSNFFGTPRPGSGSNANKTSSSGSGGGSGSSSGVAGWGSFLKQGLSTIESKLDMVLDMEVPIPGGTSTPPRRQQSRQDSVNDAVDSKSTSGDQDRISTSAIDANQSTDRSKSSNVTDEASVAVDPLTGMTTAAPGTRHMSVAPVSGISSTSTGSSESSAAAAAAAANRERLEQRMRGIFKKPAESPPSTPSTVPARSPAGSPSPSVRLSTSKEPMDKSSEEQSVEKEAESSTSIDSGAKPAEAFKEPSASVTADHNEGSENRSQGETPALTEEDPDAHPVVTETKDTKLDAKLGQDQEAGVHDNHEETDSKPELGLQTTNPEDKLDVQSSDKSAIDDSSANRDVPVAEPDPAKKNEQQTLPAQQEGTSEESEANTDDIGTNEEQDSAVDPKPVDNTDTISDHTSLDNEKAATVAVVSALDQPGAEDNPPEVVPPTTESKDISVPSQSTNDLDVGTMTGRTITESSASDENPLKKVLDQREEQLFKVMQEQSSLLERLRDLEEAKIAEDALHVTKVAGLEKMIETQKKELEVARGSNLASQPKSIQKTLEEQRALLEEKDEQIRGLLAEGEVLSKKELKNLTSIKTLRMKNIEAEKIQMDTQKKLDKVISDHTDAQAKVTKLTEENKHLNESVRSLHEINQRQNKQMTKTEAELVHLKDEKANLQLSLDRARQALEEARKASAELSNQAHAAALEREVKMNESLNNEIEALKAQHTAIESSLRQDIQELRVSLSNREELAGEREDQLMMEVRSLQSQLEQNGNDSYELQEALDEARRPLLRQIEALQNQQSIANRNWERIEKSLTSRVTEAEEDVVKAQEREKAARDKMDELKSQTTGLESRIETLRMTETQLRSETSTCRRISKEKEDEARQAQAELTRERVVRERAIEEAKEDAERKLRLQQAEMDKLKQQIQRLQQQRQGFPDDNSEGLSVSGIVGRSSTSSPMLSAPPMPKSAIAQGAGSNFDSITSPTSQDGFAPMMLRSSSAQTMSGAGVSSSVGLMNFGGNASGQAVAIERLNTMVRQLEGQVTFLNEQVRTANKNKDELSDELVRVTMELEEMQSHASRASGIDQELSLLQQRHKAALEMLGEKTEEVQELRADLHDVKEAYRDQINDLLGQLESLRRVNA